MCPESTLSSDYLQRYSITKKAQLLRALKQLQFSGSLIWTDKSNQQWTLFLNQGQIIYGTGGSHFVRRWQRCILSCCPYLNLDTQTLEYELSQANRRIINCWEHNLLYFWMAKQKVTTQEIAQIIHAIVTEILFDVIQAADVTYQLQKCQPIPVELVPVKVEIQTAFTAAQTIWRDWLDADLEPYSPNLAPVIKKADYIRNSMSLQAYKTFCSLLNGQHTLRDLAVKTQRSVLQLTQPLKPYVQLDWIHLIPVTDYPAPTPPIALQQFSISNPNSFLIACVDDSPMVCQSMEQVIRAEGYQFLAIMNAPRAIATLLTRKPDLIFLDLIMPETNGYEICSQLRKISCFKDTPIIILTGNDGLIDQARARLLGATDFLSKPMEPTVISSTIHKHLGQLAIN